MNAIQALSQLSYGPENLVLLLVALSRVGNLFNIVIVVDERVIIVHIVVGVFIGFDVFTFEFFCSGLVLILAISLVAIHRGLGRCPCFGR